jgi:hypothetical protein
MENKTHTTLSTAIDRQPVVQDLMVALSMILNAT